MASKVRTGFMIRNSFIALAALAVGAGLTGSALAQDAAGTKAPAGLYGPSSVADLAENLLDAVVNISTTQAVAARRSVPMPQLPEGSPFQEFFDEFFNRQNKDQDQPRRVRSLGSGFVIDGKKGIIITNNHVIEDADEITVNFNDGSKLTATLIGRDKKTDLAVLKVEPKKELKAVSFGDSDHSRVGDWVMAIGNPFGLGGTVTVGIVSARNRDINSGPYDNFIQTDAAINRGNSGGPLFDMQGKVIGINTAIISPSGGSIGIGFAIPSDTTQHVIAQLQKYGETRRGWLGVRIQQVTDEIAESLSMDRAHGALVAGVDDAGPAGAAGIESGDVITTFDGKDVPGMRELPRIVADTEIGKEVVVVILRKGKEVTLSVKVGHLKEGEVAAEDNGTDQGQVETVATNVLGMELTELNAESREKFKIGEDMKGVLVDSVDSGSAAEEKRVVAGDVIVEVAQEPVATPEDVAKQVAKLKKEGRRTVLLLLSNANGELRFVAVRTPGDAK
ncbi:DegQ family serine endoprotease [Breoghania sp.]|uniref:DegQ family serine endoprotease n=1 Tax=Breoghania sp. TaxID=2065378 RepID=UPI002603CFA5|nr:DegQ family serine endoprotease [Breoghania sp.]MDJ0931192.1 DegQ family serine endoprotease [Breoghania sp.]